MNAENIKKAFDLFQNDNLVDSKEILRQEIKDHKDQYISNKLELNDQDNDNDVDE